MKFVLTVTINSSALIFVYVLVGSPKTSHWVKPALTANVPTGHGKQRVEPALRLNVPGKHSSHPVAPYLFIHEPAGQADALGVPGKNTKKPGGDGRQKLLFGIPTKTLNVPGVHAVQAVCPDAF